MPDAVPLWIDIVAVLLGLLGIIGCVAPVLPGPPVSWCALLLLYFAGSGMSLKFLLIWLAVAVVVTVIDYLVPAWFTRAGGGSKAAGRGTIVGLLIGMFFFPPVGIVAGAFFGALIAEILVNGKKPEESLRPALGSFLGFLCGTLLKLIASGLMFYYTIKFL